VVATAQRKTLSAMGVVRVPPLAEQVYKQLTTVIVSLGLPPGQRVVIEQLASFLSVSRTPLREALPRLIGDGLLEELGNGQLRVTPITEQYVREVHETRAGLEAMATLLAANRIPQDILASIQRHLESVASEIAVGNFIGYFETDAELHESLLRHSGNAYLIRVLGGLHNHVYRIRNFSQSRPGSHVFASHTEHLQIVDAVMKRDGPCAKDFMESHVLAAGERLAALVGQLPTVTS
jgi:DNA-binding GntR family transcriptional regulator